MRVNITIGNDEVLDAIREWMQSKGIPVMALDGTLVRCRLSSGWTTAEDLKVEVSFTCDAYSSQDVTPIPVAPANVFKVRAPIVTP